MDTRKFYGKNLAVLNQILSDEHSESEEEELGDEGESEGGESDEDFVLSDGDENCESSEDETEEYYALANDFVQNEGPTEYISRSGEIVWTSEPCRGIFGRRNAENIVRSMSGPSRHSNRNVDTVSSAFCLFVTNPLISEVLKWINKEGTRVLGENWMKIDEIELKKFFGVLILIGVFKSHNEPVEQLWSPEYGRGVIREAMSRNRFKEFTRFLRFDDAEMRRATGNPSKLGPIQNVFEIWRKSLSDAYVPSEKFYC